MAINKAIKRMHYIILFKTLFRRLYIPHMIQKIYCYEEFMTHRSIKFARSNQQQTLHRIASLIHLFISWWKIAALNVGKRHDKKLEMSKHVAHEINLALAMRTNEFC